MAVRIWQTSVTAADAGKFVILPDARADLVLVIDRSTGEPRRLDYTGFDVTAKTVELSTNSILIGIQFDASTCIAAQEIVASDRLESAIVRSALRSALYGVPFDGTPLRQIVLSRYDSLVRMVIHRLKHNPMRDQIAIASSAAGVSIRTIERRFTKSTGLSPTDFLRVYRFLALKKFLAINDPYVDLALRVGYSDQAHMCREVRRITSMTPRVLASFMKS